MAILGPAGAPFATSHSDFLGARRAGSVCVDETAFIADVVDAGHGAVLLLPRPRRFGKTTNLSMLRAFFERSRDDTSDAFEGTEIWGLGEAYRRHFRAHPVIWLSFKDVKFATWSEAHAALHLMMRGVIGETLGSHAPALHAALRAPGDDLPEGLGPQLPESLDALRAAYRGDVSALSSSLRALVEVLHKATGEPVIILVDEYDTPLISAWLYGYWDEAATFFRAFLSGGLKDAPALGRAVLTGILRVAKENIFSGLNNVQVRGLLDPRSAERFGFLEAEVEALAERAGLGGQMDEFRRWYYGYQIGGTRPVTVYNPWSIMNRCANPEGPFWAYWVNSSSDDLVRDMLTRTAATHGPALQRLVQGEAVEAAFEDAVPLRELGAEDDHLWPLLTMAGYLTPERVTFSDDGARTALRIPNLEVQATFRRTFLRLVGAQDVATPPTTIARAILAGDAETLEDALGRALSLAMSYHDVPRATMRVEAVYQAFIVGLLLHLMPTHRVVSNREAGFGRADVLIFPRIEGATGAVLGLKVVTRRETPETALDNALSQLRTRDYAAELRAAGASTVLALGVVFDGKRCWAALA
jgi:hypothetical protein